MVFIVGRFWLRRQRLQPSRFLQDGREEPTDRVIIERPQIVLERPRDDFFFSFAREEIKVHLTFELADFNRAGRTAIEQLDELSINLINLVAPIVNVHVTLS